MYTVTGISSPDGSTSVRYDWTRSGGGDGKDGNYHTTYTVTSEGWKYEVTDDQGNVVNTGTGSPPSASSVGTSSQSVNDDGSINVGGDDDDPTDGTKPDPNAPAHPSVVHLTDAESQVFANTAGNAEHIHTVDVVQSGGASAGPGRSDGDTDPDPSGDQQKRGTGAPEARGLRGVHGPVARLGEERELRQGRRQEQGR